jgi:hypothetical protein
MKRVTVDTSLERIIITLRNSVSTARTHLNEHLSIEGAVISLDKQCKYCKIYFMAREIIFRDSESYSSALI